MEYGKGMSILVLSLGLFIILVGVGFAFYAFYNYKPLLPAGGGLEEAITSSTFDLINLAAQIAFLGVGIWGGSILLREGFKHVGREGSGECIGQREQAS